MPEALALIPAAGFGTRFHDAGPKALVLLAGKPLLLHALERLAASGRVSRAIVAAAAGYDDAFRSALASSPLPYVLCEGGVTRRDSVANALRASGATGEELVLIHDAARPLVDPEEVGAVVGEGARTGAAVAAFSLVNTLKRVHSGKVVETVPRHEYVST
ncbi:MAG TPA: 2-C-methyl-D-erythritol 4-phosphate cytidylyltransferase, partial [Thermoanaerobaculia bacterium]|nr:2-C-methyl-D-erythritol 4-phosphate cytidylyltransferase [Thermoanaerobaculia bacterium]